MDRPYPLAKLVLPVYIRSRFQDLDIQIHDDLYLPALAEAYWLSDCGYEYHGDGKSDFLMVGMKALAPRIRSWKKQRNNSPRIRFRALYAIDYELFFHLMNDEKTSKAFLCLKAMAFASRAIHQMDDIKFMRRVARYLSLD